MSKTYIDFDNIPDWFKNVIVMYNHKNGLVWVTHFNTKEEAADFIGVKPCYINRSLEGQMLYGKRWKSNLFFKPVDENYEYRYIIVYKEDWINYSKVKRQRRLKKLTQQNYS